MLIVVEGRRHLNQTMKGCFLFALHLEPARFQRFMRFEKAMSVEQFDALGNGRVHLFDFDTNRNAIVEAEAGKLM